VTTRGLNLKRRLRAGEVTIGAWISFAESAVAEIMAGSGFDWILIDTEHAPFSPEGLQTVLTAFNGQECVPIVRVPWNNPAVIKQALDLGAGGVLVPMVNTPDEARAAVAACRYPPEGIRGFGPRRASGYYRRVAEYVASANESVIIALQIEHIEAVKSIADIVAVPGIDVICLGPNDLSGSMGLLCQIEHPSVVEAITRVLDEAARHRITTCLGMAFTPAVNHQWVSRGARFIIAAEDQTVLRVGVAEALRQNRASLSGS
jgi:2-keto-3-deoxy-L-rhamnonate aldolase RhmA